MPAPWAAWARILSCKQQSSITTVQEPHKKKAKAGNKTTSPSVVGSPLLLHRKGSNGYGHNNPARRRRRSMAAATGPPGSCCNNLKSVVHGNTRVVHRGDQDSPLPPHAQEASMKELEASELHVATEETTRAPPPKKLSATSCYDCFPTSSSSSSLSDAAPPDTSFFPHGPALPRRLTSSSGDVRHSPPPPPTLPPASSQRTGDARQSPVGLAGEHDPAPAYYHDHHRHHHHSVTELRDGDSARSIVEIIFQTSWRMRQGMPTAKPEGIYKVHNSPKALAKFEEYRESVKAKASKTGRKNSRCLVDGNELLRFYSTTVSCKLGRLSSSTEAATTSVSEESVPVPLCTSSSCGVCCILRHGFPRKGYPGIYTNASSGRAHEMGPCCDDDGGEREKRAMLVCRVIAGRVKKMGLESSQDGSIPSVYDSVAGEATPFTQLEELLVFNARAVLPCFMVIYSCSF